MSSILTVLVSTNSYDLTILSTLKVELNITNTDNDEQLREWIHRASEDINDYCGRIFAKETLSEMWRGWDINRPLILRRTPINSITSITYGEETVIDSGLYEFNANNGMIWSLDSDGNRYFWPWAWSSTSRITVVYVGGYELLDELPRPVEEACLELIKHRWLGIRREENLRSIEIPGVITKQFDTNMEYSKLFPDRVKDLLSKYRKTVIG